MRNDITVVFIAHSRNRYILECKVLHTQIKYLCACVEIDTFWNVKAVFEVLRCGVVEVEIDTFWNVKMLSEPLEMDVIT